MSEREIELNGREEDNPKNEKEGNSKILRYEMLQCDAVYHYVEC